MSLRNAINQHCKNCIHDEIAAGTWRQQVTLCSVFLCHLHDVRPKAKGSIPLSVLRWYGLENEPYEG